MEQENQYISKKAFNFSIITLIVIVLSLFFATYYVLSNKFSTIEDDEPVFDEITDDNNIIPENNSSTSHKPYKLQTTEGKIGIYENDILIETLDIYTFTLPKNDQKLLLDGISASTKEELDLIISSYS